jgi:hypothetical protein
MKNKKWRKLCRRKKKRRNKRKKAKARVVVVGESNDVNSTF